MRSGLHGLLITNASLRGGGFDHARRAFMDAAKGAGIALAHTTNAALSAALAGSAPCPDGAFARPGFALFYDKDVRLAAILEKSGMRVFNSARAIALCDDKTLTHIALQGALPMPDTLVCPLVFPGTGALPLDFIARAGERLGWPLVIKEGCGSLGQQVYLAQNAGEAAALLRGMDGKPALFQRFIAESAGRDARLFVVGGRVIAAIQRRNPNDFRANAHGGGQSTVYHPTAAEQALALAACRLLALDFAGVDLLFSKSGPLLCEVNSNAHFAALTHATGVDPAAHILSHIREAVCKR